VVPSSPSYVLYPLPSNFSVRVGVVTLWVWLTVVFFSFQVFVIVTAITDGILCYGTKH